MHDMNTLLSLVGLSVSAATKDSDLCNDIVFGVIADRSKLSLLESLQGKSPTKDEFLKFEGFLFSLGPPSAFETFETRVRQYRDSQKPEVDHFEAGIHVGSKFAAEALSLLKKTDEEWEAKALKTAREKKKNMSP